MDSVIFYYYHAHTTVGRNADDLIAEFWRKNPNRRRAAAKSKPKTSPQTSLLTSSDQGT